MIELDIDSNAEDFRRKFGALAERQIPFAVARSLTNLANDARSEIIAQFPKVFRLRNRRTLTSVITERANKTDSISVMQSLVAIRDPWIAQHDTGRDKTPQRGPSLFIPTGRGAAQGSLTRGASGATKTAFKPSAIIRAASQKRKRPTFIQTVNGNQGVFQRTTKSRYPIRMIYLLEPRAEIKSDRIQARQITELIVRQRWPIYFVDFLDNAIKTAR